MYLSPFVEPGSPGNIGTILRAYLAVVKPKQLTKRNTRS